jgi:hypothetical protein
LKGASHFTKTQILGGLQCEKQLWLRLHHPELMEPTESPATVTGRVVEVHARLEFSDAVLVERSGATGEAYARTSALLNDPSVGVIFEAGFQGEDVSVFVDVLERGREGWVLTEIKGATSVKDAHIDDVATQALALQRAGMVVNRFWLMHINSDFVYPGGRDYRGLFAREDITAQVIAHRPDIESHLKRFRMLLDGPQPARRIGSHCNHPWPCPFRAHCTAHDAEYPVAWLPNGAAVARKLIARGIVDIRDIPSEDLSSETHQRVRRVTIQGKPELLPGAAQQLNALVYPRYYLDFECIQFAIPIWAETRPYQQLPFQWSCHVQRQAAALEHREFLDTDGEDPRRRFAEALLAACGDAGPVIVYNQSFEKRIIRELAETFPDLGERLAALNARIFDLLPVVRQNYYHPDMKGSWSIKSVLPCLVPDLSYEQLGSVQEGTRAQAAYLDLIGDELDKDEKQALRKDLLAYCGMDTLAMVKISERLCE